MDQTTLITFLVLVFGTVLLLSQIILVPSFGTRKKDINQFKKRLKKISEEGASLQQVSLVREKYLKKLNPLERWLESFSIISHLENLTEQSGRFYPAYRVFLVMIGLAVTAAVITWVITSNYLAVIAVTILGFWTPVIKLKKDRADRLAKFEEQLPDAIDMMVRSLRSGYPFNDAMAYVSDEMPNPIGKEFGIIFDEMNFGRDLKTAILSMLARVPSMTLVTTFTAILIQRETGGSLAEILQGISSLLRKRFRFQRRIQTLSAEGRMSAWVLALLPFFFFFIMYFINPDYLIPLLTTESGRYLLIAAVLLVIVGSFWVRKLITIDI